MNNGNRDTDVLSVIGDLIGLRTVSRDPNRELLDYVVAFLERHGVSSDIIWNEDRSKGNLWATIGPTDVSGVILSGHSDVVPTDGQPWSSDPFTMRLDEGRIYGRGACDMKGFIGIVLAAVPDLAKRRLRAPIHIAISYDEELGCTGVRSLIDRLATMTVKPALCIVGEPTSMQVVTGHKGGGMYRATVTGRAAHSSLAPRAVNAIEYAVEMIGFIKSLAAKHACDGPHDHDYDLAHSTISVNMINGGTALNIVPDQCSFDLDIRALPVVEARDIIRRIEEYAIAEILPRMREIAPESRVCIESLVEIVALDTDVTHPAVSFVKRLAGSNSHAKVAYGTEAGLFSTGAGIVSVVCGPGSIEQAHRPDEFLALSQIDSCRRMISRLADCLETEGLTW